MYATQMLRAGRTHDYEDSRSTYRLQQAYGILAAAGVEPVRTHSDTMAWDWATNRDRHVCDYRCKVTWPEWVTNDMLEAAYNLADAAQTARGAYNRRDIGRVA